MTRQDRPSLVSVSMITTKLAEELGAETALTARQLVLIRACAFLSDSVSNLSRSDYPAVPRHFSVGESVGGQTIR